MNKTNLELIYKIAQNIMTYKKGIEADITHWRILDSGYYEGINSLCIINDVEGYREDQTIFNVEYSSKNHSGLGFTYIEEGIVDEEITSDITFSIEVDKDYKVGDTIDYDLVFTLPKENLGDYGFTFHYLSSCGYDTCPEQDNFIHPCGTDISTLFCNCEEE